jgi:hypothetical protein
MALKISLRELRSHSLQEIEDIRTYLVIKGDVRASRAPSQED